MSDLQKANANRSAGRPFPWFCPRCRNKAVWRVTIPYQCERWHNGKPLQLVIPQFAVPRCDNCGELVFDYDAEEQINQALRRQLSGDPESDGVNGVKRETEEPAAPQPAPPSP
jgi:hypothetical protein